MEPGISDVLSMKARLAEGWTSKGGREFITQYAQGVGDNPRLTFNKIVREIVHSQAMWVSPDICDLLEFSVRSWPAKFTLKLEDIPVRNGFVMFSKPLWLPQRHLTGLEPDTAHLGFISWNLDKLTAEESVGKYLGQEALGYSFYSPTPFNDPIKFGIYHSSGWLVGMDKDWSFLVGGRMINMSENTRNRVDLATKYLVSFLRFISSEIIDGTRVAGREVIKNNSARRKLEKGIFKKVPDVLVVRLRKVAAPEGCEESPSDHREVHWRGQWPVSSHWREQYYPSTKEHRPRWIWGYTKGPKHLPLIEREKAFKVDR